VFDFELHDDWKVISENGVVHVLKCTFQPDYPLITDGWDLFKTFYHLPNSVEVVLCYHGDRCFSIKSIKRIDYYAELLPFHSRCCNIKETEHFEVVMGAGDVLGMTLVK
jgi:hypothetical protein